MVCNGCGNSEAWAVHNKKENLSGKIYQECNKCFDQSIPENPDVYFRKPYWDEQLLDYDDPTMDPTRGTFIRSKQHKAWLMKKLGVREAAYKTHGFRNDEMWKYREKHGFK